MIRLLQWLWGYVRFEFSHGFVEGFVNDCFGAGANVQDLVRSDDVLLGSCSAKTYFSLRHIARKNGGTLKIIEKHGPIFAFLKLRNRWGLFVGALCFVVIICFVSCFVWNIEITGNSKIPTADIMLFLEENGVSIGAYSRGIDRDIVESLIMASFDDCAWAHINIDGTTATVEFDETIPKPDVVESGIVTNVKSTHDAHIVKIVAYDGWQVVSAGDSVVAGDLLISGIREGEGGKRNVFAHAMGRVLARVDEPIDLIISRQQCKKKYVDTIVFKSLYFFGVRIPLYLHSSQIPNADMDVDHSYLVVNGHELPIGVITKTAKVFSVENVVLDDKDLNALITDEVNKHIARKYSDCEIISKKIDVSLNSAEAHATGTLCCVMDIGKEELIKIDDKKDD